MTMLKTLIKKQFSEYYALLFSRKRTDKPRSNSSAILMTAVFALVFISLAAAFYGMGELFANTMLPLRLEWLYFAVMGLIAIFLGIMGNAFTSYSIIYKAKDNDLLLSLPIPPRMIIFTRILAVYVTSLLFVLVVFLPANIVFWKYTALSVTGVIFPIVMIFLISLIVLCLSLFLGWVVALIASRVKNKTVITILATLLIFAIYYFCYFKMNEALQSLAANSEQIAGILHTYAYPCWLMGNASAGDPLSFAVFFTAVCALFALIYYVLSKTFIRIITRDKGQNQNRRRNENVTNTSTRTRSISSALLAREFKRFLSTPAYMMNQGLGLLILIVGAVILFIKKDDITGVIGPLSEILPITKACLPLLVTFAAMFVLCLNSFTSPSISLEGNTLWILRSIPTDTLDIFRAKEKMHIILNTVVAQIFVISSSLIFGLSLLSIIFAVLLVQSFIMFTSKLGLYLNLKKPNFSWTSETMVVKQSASVGFSILFSFLTVIVLGGISGTIIYFAGDSFTLPVTEVILLIAALIILLVTFLLGKKIRTTGVELFEEM